MASRNLFFALMPPADAAERLAAAAAALRHGLSPAGPLVGPDRLHLTLLFLGGPDDAQRVECARQAADTIRQRAFDLVLDSAASFPGSRAPWVLRGTMAQAACLPLHAALAAALHAVGLHGPDEHRAYVPHVTVIRHAVRALAPTSIAPVAWRAQDFVLLASQAPDAPYRELGRWALR